ncbi:NUDIX hydrolase [Thermus tenuipuniceus]|uniref:NUDIX hydrolase n=1 Tax=Thermus tenuipuniceus TaxID=2078690 RepID=UPI000CF98620|nr:NUDIX hydrolase [Thermus tenuipuniceus]
MQTAKPLKRAVALAAWSEEGLLLVKRPEEDPEFGGAWGLPAVSLVEGEGLEEVAFRVAQEKLQAEVAAARPVACGIEERPAYTLELWVLEARLLTTPRLPEPKPGKTFYTAFRFGKPEELRGAARVGSLCSRLYLAVKGLCS